MRWIACRSSMLGSIQFVTSRLLYKMKSKKVGCKQKRADRTSALTLFSIPASLHYYAYQLPLYHNHLLGLFAFQRPDDAFGSQRGGAHGFVAGTRRDGDALAHFAVDLHRDGDLVFLRGGFVHFGPGLGMDAVRFAHLGPQFFGYVRRDGSHHLDVNLQS